MIAHIRTHLQFYFVLVTACSFTVFMRVDDISRLALLAFVSVQSIIAFESSRISMEKNSGWFDVMLAAVHFGVTLLYFERFIYASR